MEETKPAGSGYPLYSMHPVLLNPLREWVHRTRGIFDSGLLRDLTDEIAEPCGMDADVASAVVSRMIR